MTHKQDDTDDSLRDPGLAAFLALRLVNQILDEAYITAKSAEESGQPWDYLSMMNNLKNSRLETDDETDTSLSFIEKEKSENLYNNTMGIVVNVAATSTPQKVSELIMKDKPDSNFIGQGDEEIDMEQHDLNKSTSTFINHLFDMSEVEVVLCDDIDDPIVVKCKLDSRDLIMKTVTNIMEICVNTALNTALEKENDIIGSNVETEKSPITTENSSYSFLSDILNANVDNGMEFYTNNAIPNEHKHLDILQAEPSTLITTEEINCNENDNIKKSDIAMYENVYLTLNRDYDQYSDDNGFPVLQDPKSLMLQEVELLTAHTSDENLCNREELVQKRKELAATSAISASASGSRKSSIAKKCRLLGVRVLACLRGYWRRKTPGKRKKPRLSDKPRIFCPLSPDARRRATSLLDHTCLQSPSPSRSVVWKFNTVNEALVNSTRWKEYTFETQPDECGE